MKATCEQVYKLSELTFEDMEAISIGLEELTRCEPTTQQRNNELIKIIDEVLNTGNHA